MITKEGKAMEHSILGLRKIHKSGVTVEDVLTKDHTK